MLESHSGGKREGVERGVYDWVWGTRGWFGKSVKCRWEGTVLNGEAFKRGTVQLQRIE